MRFFKAILFFCFTLVFYTAISSADNSDAFKQLELKNANAELSLTPEIGGRVLSYRIPGHPNFLKVGDGVVKGVRTEVSPDADTVPYYGHIIWAGPQSAWWVHQDLNTDRRDRAALWPQDPYISFAENTVETQSESKVSLRGVPSLLAGIRIDKSFELNDDGSIELMASVTNLREKKLAWDVWFNTRVLPESYIYVPVNNVNAFRYSPFPPERFDTIKATVHDDLFTLERPDPDESKVAASGKYFIQPSRSWMAAFHEEQVFIIRFPLADNIHTEHALVEIFADFPSKELASGMIEMEVHSSLKMLAKGETVQGSEQWFIHAYSGKHSREAHQAFLKQVLADSY